MIRHSTNALEYHKVAQQGKHGAFSCEENTERSTEKSQDFAFNFTIHMF